MSRSPGPAHIIRREEDGTSSGAWGAFLLRSAFQPIFAFGEGGRLRAIAFEGLARPERNGEAVSPAAFFAAVPAGERMHVETLTRTLHLLNAGACLHPSALLFVNFDPSLFSDRQLIEAALSDMRAVLHEAGIDPARIVCEVTEKPTASEQALYLFVLALREHGFRIAVDDYGAEDSGIRRIRELKPDIVKFDAQWITRLMNTQPGFALLETMVADFRAKGILNLFEGIEEPWQLELAERCGVDMVQGYVLARPEIAPTSFARFFAAGDEASTAVMEGRLAEAPSRPRREPGAKRSFGRRG